jgi:transcriptional regulator with XRE-family HTH domain
MTDKKKIKKLPHDVKKIGLRLRSIRKSLGYGNSDDFANHYDLNRSQYGKYEAGSEDLRISSLIKVLEKIHFTLKDFFNEEYDAI